MFIGSLYDWMMMALGSLAFHVFWILFLFWFLVCNFLEDMVTLPVYLFPPFIDKIYTTYQKMTYLVLMTFGIAHCWFPFVLISMILEI